MNKLVLMTTAVAALSFATGCASFSDPWEMERGDADNEVYKTEFKVPQLQRQKIVIVNKIAMPDDHFAVADKYIKDRMESSVASYFTNLGCFDTLDRKNGMTIDSEAILSADKNNIDPGKVAGADKVIIAETSYRWIGGLSLGYKATFDPQKGEEVVLTSNFRLIDLASKETIISKTYEANVRYEKGTGGWQKGVDAAANQNAKNFARAVSARLLPPAVVKQTRENGWAAEVSMGKNYMAEPGALIEFLMVQDGEPISFARGTVYSAGDKSAWVEVHENGEGRRYVRKGHFAKLVDEDKAEK